ncbi:outer membrane protein [Sphaerotilus hippei]|uniref:Outer membrane protein n=1 Tax=Sphaerotilus hippei TaxID=744406 RepID=A0A318H602_9BURK|nr:TolC family outer membrane protein [Sphaerotilus hippei]PXW94693.1 outer membrane protein [Sphaerotilus hippei]
MNRLIPSPLAAMTLAALALMTSQVRAQSLQEVYEAARAYDAIYLSARAQAEATSFQVGQAEAARRPTLGLNAGLQGSNSDTPLAGNRNLRTASVGLQANQSLYNRASSASVDKARKGVEVSQADLQAAEQDLIVRVAQAYFDVLTAREALAAAQASQKAIGVQLASAKRNFEVGTATITDTREAQARADLSSAQVIAADNDLRVKRTYLDQLVGRTGVDPRPLAPAAILPGLPEGNVDQWIERSQDAPLVRKARLGGAIAKDEIERVRAGKQPTVGLTGSVGLANNNGTAAPSSGGEGTSRTASVGVNLQWPLFTGGLVENQVREALKLEEKSRSDLDNARRSVAQGVRQAYFGVESGIARVRALEAAESSSKLALDATQLGYKVGVRVNLDVLNAQSQLYSTQSELAKARYDLLATRLKLQQATGVLTPADLEPVSSLMSR